MKVTPQPHSTIQAEALSLDAERVLHHSAQLIDDGYMDLALKQLWQLQCQDLIVMRRRGFFIAKALMRLEQPKDAIAVLLRTMTECGEHVSLLAELGYCYYAVGDYAAWRRITEDLHLKLRKIGPLLSAESWYRTALTLGKFLEELGQINQAVAMYESIVNKLDQSYEVSRELYLALAQLLRIEIEFKLPFSVERHYHRLRHLSETLFSQDFDAEVQHALFMAEWRLFGVEMAWGRLSTYFFNNPRALSADKNLACYELCLSILQTKETIGRQAAELLSNWEFESLIYQLVQDVARQKMENSFSKEWNWPEIFSFLASAKMSIGDELRLLRCLECACDDTEPAIYLRQKQQIVLQTLDDESIKIWKKYLNSFHSLETSKHLIEVNKTHLSLKYGVQAISCRRRMVTIQLCEALAENSEWKTEDLIRRIWNADYDESFYHRLRMQVNRLNDSLANLTLITRPIDLGQDRVKLCHQVRIKVNVD